MTKTALLAMARTLLAGKQAELLAMLDDLNEGLANDTKSSAGDKYETSRAMSQQEIDKVSVQLQELNRQQALLPQLEASEGGTTIKTGSLVETTAGTFFIGLPIGQLSLDGTTVFCIGPTAPVAQQLLGLTEGDHYELMGRQQRVTAVR